MTLADTFGPPPPPRSEELENEGATAEVLRWVIARQRAQQNPEAFRDPSRITTAVDAMAALEAGGVGVMEELALGVQREGGQPQISGPDLGKALDLGMRRLRMVTQFRLPPQERRLLHNRIRMLQRASGLRGLYEQAGPEGLRTPVSLLQAPTIGPGGKALGYAGMFGEGAMQTGTDIASLIPGVQIPPPQPLTSRLAEVGVSPGTGGDVARGAGRMAGDILALQGIAGAAGRLPGMAGLRTAGAAGSRGARLGETALRYGAGGAVLGEAHGSSALLGAFSGAIGAVGAGSIARRMAARGITAKPGQGLRNVAYNLTVGTVEEGATGVPVSLIDATRALYETGDVKQALRVFAEGLLFDVVMGAVAGSSKGRALRRRLDKVKADFHRQIDAMPESQAARVYEDVLRGTDEGLKALQRAGMRIEDYALPDFRATRKRVRMPLAKAKEGIGPPVAEASPHRQAATEAVKPAQAAAKPAEARRQAMRPVEVADPDDFAPVYRGEQPAAVYRLSELEVTRGKKGDAELAAQEMRRSLFREVSAKKEVSPDVETVLVNDQLVAYHRGRVLEAMGQELAGEYGKPERLDTAIRAGLTGEGPEAGFGRAILSAPEGLPFEAAMARERRRLEIGGQDSAEALGDFALIGAEAIRRGENPRAALMREFPRIYPRLSHIIPRAEELAGRVRKPRPGIKATDVEVTPSLESGSVPGLGSIRMAKLRELGVHTVQDLAHAEAADIKSAFSNSEKLAQSFIERASRQVESGLRPLGGLTLLGQALAAARASKIAWHKFTHSQTVKKTRRLFHADKNLPRTWARSFELREGGIALRSAHLHEMVKRADRLAAKLGWNTEARMEDLARFMKGKNTNERLPAELAAACTRVRMFHDSLSVELAHSGLVGRELQKVIMDRLGHYLHRWYEIFYNKKYREWVRGPSVEAQRRREAATSYFVHALDHRNAHDIVGHRRAMAALAMNGYGTLSTLARATPDQLEAVFARHGVQNPPDAQRIATEAAESYRELGELADRTMWDLIDNTEAEYFNLIGDRNAIKDLSNLQRRTNIAEPLRVLLGEVQDWRLNLQRSSQLMIEAIEHQRHFKRLIADNEAMAPDNPNRYLWTSKEAVTQPGEEVVKLVSDDVVRWGALEGYYTTREVREAILQFAQIRGELSLTDRIWRKANYYTKTVLVPLNFPAGHVRNFVSNTYFAFNNGHNVTNPKLWTQTARAILGRFKRIGHEWRLEGDRLVEDGLLDHNVQHGEWRDALERSNPGREIKVDARTRTLLSDVAAGKTSPAVLIEHIWRKGLVDPSLKSFKLADDVWKIFGYYAERGKGYSHEDAINIVKNTYPSYDRAWMAARNLSRVPLLADFPTFSAEIIRNSINQWKYAYREMRGLHPITKKPLGRRYFNRAFGILFNAGAFQAPVAGGMSAAGMVVSNMVRAMLGEDFEPIGPDQDRALRYFAPPWQEFAELVWAGRDRETGDVLVFDLDYINPYAMFSNIPRAILTGKRELDVTKRVFEGMKESLSPFYDWSVVSELFAEQVLNRYETSGERISEEDDTSLEALEKVVGHLGKKVPALRGLQRVKHGLTGEVSSFGQVYKTEEQLLGLFGFRPLRINPTFSLPFKVKELSGRLQDANSVFTSAWFREARDPRKTEKTLEAQQVSERRRRKVFGEFIALVEAARFLGMEEESIHRELVKSRISKRDRIAILEGEYVPYQPSRNIQGIWEDVRQKQRVPQGAGKGE